MRRKYTIKAICLLFFILIFPLTGCTSSQSEALTVGSSTGCHPSYSGCLKSSASDYDCAGGSGNGPYYTGRVQVIGPDVFDLDRDNDGWGCE